MITKFYWPWALSSALVWSIIGHWLAGFLFDGPRTLEQHVIGFGTGFLTLAIWNCTGGAHRYRRTVVPAPEVNR